MAARNKRIRHAFDEKALFSILDAPESAFGDYGTKYVVENSPQDFFYYGDNGAAILMVAHLDSVAMPYPATIANTANGPVLYSPTLDDRLGAYVICELLPALGIETDILLTTGEESGRSTAKTFKRTFPDIPAGRYKWIASFDRSGMDVVHYQYGSQDLRQRITASGASCGGHGAYSDIADLGYLGCAGVNWGVGYRDYHGPRAHAWLRETFAMVGYFLRFYGANKRRHLEFEPSSSHTSHDRHDRSRYGGWDGFGSYRSERSSYKPGRKWNPDTHQWEDDDSKPSNWQRGRLWDREKQRWEDDDPKTPTNQLRLPSQPDCVDGFITDATVRDLIKTADVEVWPTHCPQDAQELECGVCPECRTDYWKDLVQNLVVEA